jgi:hypothetical protein
MHSEAEVTRHGSLARTALTALAIVTVAGLAAVAGPAPASTAKTGHHQRLVGQVNWDLTKHWEDDGRGPAGNGEVNITNTTEHGSLKLNLPLRGTVTTVGTSTYNVNILRDGDAKEYGAPQLECEKLTKVTAAGSGPIPKDGFGTHIRPVSSNPHAKIGPQTEAILVQAVLPMVGTETESELYCTPETIERPFKGNANVGGTSGDKACYPKGVTPERPGSVQAGTLVGAWHQQAKSFDFTCTTSYPGFEGETITLSVSGKLKLK